MNKDEEALAFLSVHFKNFHLASTEISTQNTDESSEDSEEDIPIKPLKNNFKERISFHQFQTSNLRNF